MGYYYFPWVCYGKLYRIFFKWQTSIPSFRIGDIAQHQVYWGKQRFFFDKARCQYANRKCIDPFVPGSKWGLSEVSPEICNKNSGGMFAMLPIFMWQLLARKGSFSSWRKHLQLKNDWFQLWHLSPKEHKIHWTTSPSPGMRPQPNTLFRHRGPPSPKLSHCRKPTSILSWLSCSPHLELLGLGRQCRPKPGCQGEYPPGERGNITHLSGAFRKIIDSKGTFGICIWICFFIPRMDPMFVILPLRWPVTRFNKTTLR